MTYQSSKIYTIKNHANNNVFIGGTSQPLSRRFAGHRNAINIPKQRDSAIHVAMREFGAENFYIELLELWPCNSIEELNARVGHHIREADSFNNGYNGRIMGRNKEQ